MVQTPSDYHLRHVAQNIIHENGDEVPDEATQKMAKRALLKSDIDVADLSAAVLVPLQADTRRRLEEIFNDV